VRLLPFVRVRRNRDDRFRRFDWWRHFSVRDRTEPRQRLHHCRADREDDEPGEDEESEREEHADGQASGTLHRGSVRLVGAASEMNAVIGRHRQGWFKTFLPAVRIFRLRVEDIRINGSSAR